MIKTRFAPSPTGYLHIGGARTALYSWLYAKQHQGTFVLRIEDTDLERSTQQAVTAILEGMEWLGLSHDEGPFYQTQHLARYQQLAQQLLNEGKAYRCYCTKERLEKLREDQLSKKEKPRYDGFCRHNSEIRNEPYVIRFKNPISGVVTFDDQVRGPITVANDELDDLVIIRTDGMPTYNFSVVVDDWDMKITHVIRGDDHINNTPRQINIFNALSANPPLYAHIPMILGSDGKRLSKRHGAVSVLQYKEEGYLPEALLNYLVRLGWSYGDQEIFSEAEMVEHFNFNRISRSPASFNPEKLLWLNQHYIKTLPPRKIADQLAWHLQQMHIDVSKGPALEDIIVAYRERVKTLVEMAEKSRFFFEEFSNYDETIKKEFTSEALDTLSYIQMKLIDLKDWSKENLHQVILDASIELDIKMGKIAQPLRLAVTGTPQSPSIDLTLTLLGKAKTLSRLEQVTQGFK